jgi:hypothetical protein
MVNKYRREQFTIPEWNLQRRDSKILFDRLRSYVTQFIECVEVHTQRPVGLKKHGYQSYVRRSAYVAPFLLLLVFAGRSSAQLSIAGYGGSTISVWPDGRYAVNVQDKNWTFSGATGTGISNARIINGADNLGPYQEIRFDYAIGPSLRTAGIRAASLRPVVLFSLNWANDAPNSSPFPVFQQYPQLQHLGYNDLFAYPDFSTLPTNSPWVWFDGSANTFILSAASDYMVSSTDMLSGGVIAAGISPKIATIPAGLTHRTALVFGSGINATFAVWGQALTDLTGKRRPASDADTLLKYVSYWTDNGATYYYNAGGPSYQDTLKSVVAEFGAKGIKLGSMQLDSWWYPKGPDDSWTSPGGIWMYTVSPSVFQTDLAAVQKALGVPLATHARWIDPKSPLHESYAISGGVATDPAYWENVAAYLAASGVTTYEQDWLGAQAQSDFNLTDPYAFLNNMAASLEKRSMTMQYCMAKAEHFLQGTNYDNLTSIRTSYDRFEQDHWTHFLYTSRLASALGEFPFTDVFRSTETYNLILATLSAGPVGVGDKMGTLSRENLLQSVRSDGLIVKPDVPITPLDSVFVSDAASVDTPMLAQTWSDFGRGLRVHYVFAYSRGANKTVTIDPAALGITGAAYFYDYLNETGRVIDLNARYTFQLTDAAGYYVVMPIGSTGIAFLGDEDQFVTLGKNRIPSLRENDAVDATVSFGHGELTRTVFGYSAGLVNVTALTGRIRSSDYDYVTQMFTVKVSPAKSGSAHIRVTPFGTKTPPLEPLPIPAQ